MIDLAEILTAANTLALRKSDALNLSIIQKNVDEIDPVTDEEMRSARSFAGRERMGSTAESLACSVLN